ncbi:hypothetical protein Agub_g12060 [Astrephomene gubernaculifera]|uniref:Peptidase M11 gametolysin domain-containing protein n=1 Tax=Astrephomene gubernaculifera TaxID=47775 RepID=A0AAD3DZ86_9CHLO|nr:hypothetical protein Agub_g12060 [Astrephomene gubernaculifera]
MLLLLLLAASWHSLSLNGVGASPTDVRRQLQQQLSERKRLLNDGDTPQESGWRRRIQQSSLSELDFPTDLRWTAPALKPVIFIVNMCNKGGGAAASRDDVWRILRDSPTNLAGYYDTCSYNRTALDLSNTLVIGPLQLPCNGTNSPSMGSGPWTVTSCHGTNPYGWFYWAEQYAVNTLKVNLSTYNHRVMIMPKLHQTFMEEDCGWAGISTTGSVNPMPHNPYAYRYSYTWLAGDMWSSPWLWFHELGHALWLQHANTPAQEYGDIASSMGGLKGYGLRCYNAPQNWQLGWGSPFVVLTRNELRPGVTVKRVIPAAHLDPDHSIRIALGPGAGQASDVSGVPANCTTQLWVSYRASSSVYDMLWKDLGTSAAFVHQWEGTSFSASPEPIELASLKVPYATKTPSDVQSSSYTVDGCRLVISALEVWDGYASFGVCVKTSDSGYETNCHDGIDDDCDGLIDAKDPDCRQPPGKNLPPQQPISKASTSSDDADQEPGLIYEGLMQVMLRTRQNSPPSPPSPRPPHPPPKPKTTVKVKAAASIPTVATGRRQLRQ